MLRFGTSSVPWTKPSQKGGQRGGFSGPRVPSRSAAAQGSPAAFGQVGLAGQARKRSRALSLTHSSSNLPRTGPMNILPVDRALSIYGALVDRSETKGARKRLSEHLMKKFNKGTQNETWQENDYNRRRPDRPARCRAGEAAAGASRACRMAFRSTCRW